MKSISRRTFADLSCWKQRIQKVIKQQLSIENTFKFSLDAIILGLTFENVFAKCIDISTMKILLEAWHFWAAILRTPENERSDKTQSSASILHSLMFIHVCQTVITNTQDITIQRNISTHKAELWKRAISFELNDPMYLLLVCSIILDSHRLFATIMYKAFFLA